MEEYLMKLRKYSTIGASFVIAGICYIIATLTSLLLKRASLTYTFGAISLLLISIGIGIEIYNNKVRKMKKENFEVEEQKEGTKKLSIQSSLDTKKLSNPLAIKRQTLINFKESLISNSEDKHANKQYIIK